MSHPAGERLRCDDCGSEIIYVQACTCTDDPKRHADICCGKDMRSLGVEDAAGPMPVEHHPSV